MKTNYVFKLLLFFFIINNVLNAQIQIGADIDGEAASDESGKSVSISGNGLRVAIGFANDVGRLQLNQDDSSIISDSYEAKTYVFNTTNPATGSYQQKVVL